MPAVMQVSVCGPEILQDSVDGIGAQLVVPDRVTYPDVTAAQQGSEQSILDEMMFGLEGAQIDCDDARRDTHRRGRRGLHAVRGARRRVGGRDTDSSVSSHALRLLHGASLAPLIDDWIGPPLARVREAFGLSAFDSHRSIARQIWEGAPVAVSMLPPVLESERLSEPVWQRRPRRAAVPSQSPSQARPPAARPQIIVGCFRRR